LLFNWYSLSTLDYRTVWFEGLDATPFFYGGYTPKAGWWPVDLVFGIVAGVAAVAAAFAASSGIAEAESAVRGATVVRRHERVPFR
jgi:hypothetical protein